MSENCEAKEKIPVKTGKEEPYEIFLEDSFYGLEAAVESFSRGRRVCIVTDDTVAEFYLDEVKKIMLSCAASVTVFVFPAGEEHKTLAVVQSLYETLIQAEFDRHDLLLALGGGVVGDLTGFAAATYLRGIRFIQLPTTLLAQIDSSVGGKTGVDFLSYKNMVGAFHQPSLVYSNVKTLKTLSDEQFKSGLGELLKYGLILDAAFYEWIGSHEKEIESRSPEALRYVVSRCCELKRDIVEQDPEDRSGARAVLNFGHTIGHAIEKLEDFSLPHGICVALGSIGAAYISFKRGFLTKEEFRDICACYQAFGLPLSFKGPSAEEVVKATKKDKKMEAGKIRFILLKEIGQSFVAADVTDQEIEEAVMKLQGAL